MNEFGSIGAAIDRSVSTFRNETDPQKLSSEMEQQNFRQLGEELVKTSYNYFDELRAQGVGFGEIIRHINRIGTAGWSLYDEKDQGGYSPGNWRPYEVAMGDEIVPPHHEDVEELMEIFSGKVDLLLAGAREDNKDLLFPWAYAMLLAIHPFQDGNGRTSRATANYLRYIVTAEKSQYQSLVIPSSEDIDIDEHMKNLNKAFEDLGLFETSTDQNGVATSMAAYKAHTSSGRPEEYFTGIRERMLQHLNSVQSLDDLCQYSGLGVLKEDILEARTWKNAQTKSLAAQQATRKYEEVLYGE